MSKAVKPFPRTLLEAVRYFADLDVARGFLAHLKWPDGITCPSCASQDISDMPTRKMYRCKLCKRQFSVKVGTIFEDSPIGLDKWLPAVWALSSAKNGVSSHELARSIGVTQKTGWFMLQRIRLAMKTKGFQAPLYGTVEVDETFIGGKVKNMSLRKRKAKPAQAYWDKTAVMGVLQRGGEVRAFTIPEPKAPYMQAGVRDNVAEGSQVYTDGHHAYRPLEFAYEHRFVDHLLNQYVNGQVHTNGIENFWCLLKRAIKGTYIKPEPQHISRYVDEQVFRFNSRGLLDADRFAVVLAKVA
ncbi:MAG TPA: IS1595 family transposase, partial [Candidatus Acidoferrales bacterium]|nr:IS1595 family transposase [Candidatus Acidoferrales bacterium]